jgi:cytochrome c oxidase subunit 2
VSDHVEHQGPADAPGESGARSSWQREPHHFRRMIAIWFVAAAGGDIIYWFVAGPHVPPGTMTSTASSDQFDFNVLFLAAWVVVAAVWTYLGYAIVMWRASRGGPDPVGGPAARSNRKVQTAWIATTTVIVLGAFLFGTVELIVSAGSGGGEGPDPIWKPTSDKVLPVQVIAQQWKFTYRYPTFGGMETDTLIVPADTWVAFHVTSLDVIHSFWAYQLGVKADANPGVDDVAYTHIGNQLGSFTVRCSELCGLWHGAMYDFGRVVTKKQFMAWGTSTERAQADNTKYLPPFAWSYVPTANTTTGVFINTSGQAPYSKVEKYGATPAKKTVTSPKTVTTFTTTSAGSTLQSPAKVTAAG